jgi:hypothetical protein
LNDNGLASRSVQKCHRQEQEWLSGWSLNLERYAIRQNQEDRHGARLHARRHRLTAKEGAEDLESKKELTLVLRELCTNIIAQRSRSIKRWMYQLKGALAKAYTCLARDSDEQAASPNDQIIVTLQGASMI